MDKWAKRELYRKTLAKELEDSKPKRGRPKKAKEPVEEVPVEEVPVEKEPEIVKEVKEENSKTA